MKIAATVAAAAAAGVIIVAILDTELGIVIVVVTAAEAVVVMDALLAEGLVTWPGTVLLGAAAVAVVVMAATSVVIWAIWQETVSMEDPVVEAAAAHVLPVGRLVTWLGIVAGEAVVVAVAIGMATVLDPVAAAVAVTTVGRLGISPRSVQSESASKYSFKSFNFSGLNPWY